MPDVSGIEVYMSDYIKIAEWKVNPDKSCTAELAEQYEDALGRADISVKSTMNLCIVFDEIYANISSYSKATELTIRISKADSFIRIEFIDNGMQFDSTKVASADITKLVEEREPGGLGIHMVRKLTDSMEYEFIDNHNHLIIIKNCE